MSILGMPSRAYAPLRPSIVHVLARVVADRLGAAHRAISARLDLGTASDPGIDAPIVFTSVDGRERLVITSPGRFRSEPLGARFDASIDDSGRFVLFREPITAADCPADA